MEVKEAPALVGDVFFRRIGVDVPVARSRSESFWKEIPARGLAVSNTYGFTFFAHPDGFAVARTAHLCQLAQELKEHTDIHTTAKNKSLKSVDVSDVRSLVLSSDELVLAVITGRKVHFYDLSALILKSNSNPCDTISTGSDGSCVRDFSWSPLSARAYIMLSTKGKLVVGTLGQSDRITIEEGVFAACWSPDGHHMAYATLDSTLSIRTADLAKKIKIEIPQVLEPENDGTVQVDTVNWVRPDSIMLGCVRTNLDEDDEFQLLMIGCNNGDMAEENTSRVSVSFEPLFSALERSILPSNSGPHLLVEYVSQWHMAVATSRRSVDDHIFLLAWSSEAGQCSPYSMEMANDAWRPRIELTENRSDNIVVGMGIDRTNAQIQMADPRDETGSTMLPSCPVLLCLTLEGKLSFFLFARWGQPNVVTPSLDLPMCSTVGSYSAEQPSVGIASDAAAAELDAGHHESDEESKEDGITSEESDVSESGDFETVRGEEPEEDSGCAPQGPAPSVDSTLLKEVSASVTNEYEHSEAEKQLSSNPLPGSSPEKVALYGERTQQEKVAGELTAPELLPQNTSLFERFTKVAPQPDLTTTPAHVSEAWDVGRLSPINLFDDRSSRGHQIGAKLQPVKAEKPMGSVASALEGMYRPYSSVNTSSQVIQHVEKPYSSMSIKESLPAVPSPMKMQAVPFNQPSTQATGVRTVTPDVSQGLGGTSIAKKTEQKATAATKPSGFQKRPKENQARHMPGVSEIEADFSKELEKVREMADALDNLMSSLQGHLVKSKDDKNSPNAGATFEDLEEGTTSLSAEVKEHKKMLIETQPDVEALLEDTTRVDAWRTHVQSLLEQYADVRYRELWLHQKLHPELQRSRTSVVEADQLLKQRLADLEKHLESLELNHRQQMRDNLRRKPSTSTRSQGQYQVLQNLYNTVNTQREVAEKLAHRVTLQMNELNISSTSTSASQRTAQPAATGILRSLGVNLEEEKTSCNGALFGSPVMKQGLSPRDSTESALQTPSRQQSPREALSAHLDTTRRRRDSMDMAWVGAGAAKTTIKRAARIKPIQSLSTNQQEAVKSQLRTFRRTQKITHDSTQAPHLTKLSVDFSSPQQKLVTAIRTTVLSRQTEDYEQPNRDDWTLPPVDNEEKLLSSAPIPGWQFANQEQASSSLFKWASTNSSQTMSSSQNGASCNSSPSAVLNSSAGVSGTRTRIATASGIANVSQHGKLGQSESTTGPAATSQTTSSPHKIAVISQYLVGKGSSREPGLAAEAATTEPKSSVPSYRPSLSRKLDLDPESRYQKYGSEIRSADFDEEERQQSPRDSKMAKTRESGMNGGFGCMRERLTAFGNVGGRSSTLSSSASSLVDTSPSGLQALTTQAAPELASRTSAAGLTGSNGFGASIPSPAVISTTGATTDVGSSGKQQPEMSRAPPPESSAAKGLDPSQPAAVLADVSALGRNKSPPAAPTTPVTEQVLFPKALEKPAQSTAPVVSMAPVVPAETEAAVPTASANLTMTAVTPSPVFSPTPSAVRFGSPPPGGESPGVAQVSGGFSTSFPRFGASSSPSSPRPLFGQPSSTQGTSGQQFSFQKPSPSAILPSQLAVTGDSEEEGMEEEAPSTTTTEFAGFGGFGGLGLGTSSVSTEEKPNPFGVKSSSLSPNLGFGATAAGGQLFRPASFSLPAAQSSPPSTGNLFGGQNHSMTSGSIFGQSGLGSGSTSAGFGSSTSFGQAAKVGQGQQALGDALGAFGQTRQLGSGFGASGFSAATSIGGFSGTASGGGFASAATGGGFASAATGGGFASAATGGGFASAATGGGFAGVAAGGGFAAVAQGGGFAGSSGGASFGSQSPSGGFQSFSANQGSTGFGGFGASPGFGAASQAPLFTQMRK